MIRTWIFSIGAFSATNELCSLVFIRVGPLYIISSWFFYSWIRFLYLGTLLGSISFNELFVVEILREDLRMIFSLPMLTNPSATFTMFLLCYAQCFGYLIRTMFPSPSILQHYIEFDIRTITTLEKLLSARSFGVIIGHLACCQATFLVFFNKLDLPSVIWTIAFTYLGCWALIVLALVICF